MKKYLLFGKSRSKPKPVYGVVMEKYIRTEYDLGDIEHLKADQKHKIGDKEYALRPDASGVFRKKGFFGRVKRQIILFDLINPDVGQAEIIPWLPKPFDPVKMWSAEKAGLNIHETVTRRGIRGMFPKLPGGGFGGNKKLMFVLMFAGVIVALILHFVLKVF